MGDEWQMYNEYLTKSVKYIRNGRRTVEDSIDYVIWKTYVGTRQTPKKDMDLRKKVRHDRLRNVFANPN